MVEKNKMILSMIDDNYSIQDIRKKLDIDYKELNIRLNQIRRSGYGLINTYMNTGEIYPYINKELEIYKDHLITTLNVKEHTSSFHFLAISDTHFGHKNDSIEMIDNLYNYASNNGIHNIVNTGDFIESDYTNQKYMRNKTIESQLNYVIKNYPYSDDIMNYILLGNHDQHSLTYNGLNIMNVLNNKRYDFNCLGYGLHTLKIRNVNITLRHQLNGENIGPGPYSELTLVGHSHDLKMDIGEIATIHLPTCSLVSPGNDDISKYNVGALDINIKLDNMSCKTIEIKELDPISKVKVKNVITYRVGHVKNNRRK